MKKIIFQAAAIVGLFLLMWFTLGKVDWISLLKVEQVSKSTEEKLGSLFWDALRKSDKEIEKSEVILSVDSIFNKICTANGIERNQIKLHIIENDEINAFALPGKHLVVHSSLILASENEAELSGVLSHELAHLELNHVMKKLRKEIGLSVIISMTGGGSGSKIIEETAKLLSSSAYDRNLEKEADIKAVDYLTNANIDPEPFANFLFKLADKESATMKNLSWISTHPGSIERAKYIIEYSKGKIKNFLPIVSSTTWDQLQKSLKAL